MIIINRLKASLLQHHVPPVDIVDVALLVRHSCEAVRVTHPKHAGHLLGEFKAPFDLFAHRIEHYDFAAV